MCTIPKIFAVYKNIKRVDLFNTIEFCTFILNEIVLLMISDLLAQGYFVS